MICIMRENLGLITMANFVHESLVVELKFSSI